MSGLKLGGGQLVAPSVLGEIRVPGTVASFSGFPSGRKTQLDLMPEDSGKFRKAAKRLGLKVSKRKTGFLYHGDDRVGAMTKVLGRLGGAKINVVAIDAVTSGKGRFGAIFWVRPKAVAKAAKALGAK